jgi:hypothetical protein
MRLESDAARDVNPADHTLFQFGNGLDYIRA